MSNTPKLHALAGSTRRIRKGASRAAAADPNETLHLSIYLRRPPNAPPLLDQQDFAARPLAPHRRLTRQQLADQYGATAQDLHAVTNFVTEHGLAVEEVAPERRLVRVSGTVAQIAKAFSVELYNYESPKEKYRGHEGPVHVPASLAATIQGVFGLDNRKMARRAGGGTGVGNVTPPQVAQAYNFPANSAAGQTVAVLEFSGPTPTEPTCGFAQSDIDGYINFLNTTTGTALNSTTVTPVTVDPSSVNPGDLPGGSATNFNIQTDADVEVALDLEIIVSLAQGASVVAYFAPSTEKGWVDAINQIVADTDNDPDVLSISWGWSELESTGAIDLGPPETFNWPFEWTQAAFTQMTQAFQDAANIGMTVFVSAGDAGSDCGEDDGNAHVLYPASDPWITCCGGTTITGLSPLTQDTWNDNTIDPGAATGGGISYLASKPSWQSNANVPVSVNPDHHVGRGLPDVAGNADFNSGYILYLYGTTSDKLIITAPVFAAGSPLGPVGGTSAVGPLYASLIARINASLGTRVGYLNPTLYQLGLSGVFQDINDGVSNSVTTDSGGTSPGYTSGPGWDACTGWGTINGATLLSALQPIYQKSVSLILDRSTFGQDEVSAGLKNSSAMPPKDLFQDAFFVVVEGYTPTELGLTTTNLDAPPNFPAFSGSFHALGDPAIAFDQLTGVQLEDSSELDSVQRITYPYNITFSSINAFSGLSLTNPSAIYGLSATITNAAVPGYPAVTSQPSPIAEFELVYQADPFMDHGETWWLSNDMRVFQYTPATAPSTIPLTYSFTAWTDNPNTYLHNLLAELNKSFTDPSLTNTPFTGISSDELASYLNLTGTDGHGNPIYNFGLARVHLQGDTATNVRTFFRLFISSSPDTDFSTTTTFRSAVETDPTTGNPIPGTLIPLLGFPDSDMSSTIPFFAAPRVDSTSLPLTAQTDPDNVQTIPSPTAPAPVPGAEVYAYFGCWLDLNQATPQFPINPNTQAKPDGPYPAADILSIPVLIMSDHACLVAQIAYDPDTIPAGANASTSDKIGQRNLSWTSSGNPGPIAGHVVPTLFDLKLTSPEIPQHQLPDELMIEWGHVPAGSLASIYWPQVNADDVLALADRHYALNQLTKKDAHTLQVTTGSLTYIPIPAGTGSNLAGMLTIDLPAGVRTGQQFDVVVRRLRTRNIKGGIDNNANSATGPDFVNNVINWRYVVGAFQIRIPVAADPILLEPEESLLALFKWKIDQIPATNRWNPVLARYIQQVSGRVDAFGGNASSIPPSQNGYPGIIKAGHHHPHHHENTGKVSGVIYDRFGDFEGFTLLTEHGVEHLYLSREEEIERLIRFAWEDRIVISVFASHHHPDHPTAIVLRRTARPI